MNCVHQRVASNPGPYQFDLLDLREKASSRQLKIRCQWGPGFEANKSLGEAISVTMVTMLQSSVRHAGILVFITTATTVSATEATSVTLRSAQTERQQVCFKEHFIEFKFQEKNVVKNFILKMCKRINFLFRKNNFMFWWYSPTFYNTHWLEEK